MTHPRRITVCLAALLATSVLSGCGVKVTQMYSGERLPAAEVALIEPTSSFKPLEGHSIRTYVLAVDGQELAEGAAEVLPGRHTVRAAAILSAYCGVKASVWAVVTGVFNPRCANNGASGVSMP